MFQISGYRIRPVVIPPFVILLIFSSKINLISKGISLRNNYLLITIEVQQKKYLPYIHPPSLFSLPFIHSVSLSHSLPSSLRQWIKFPLCPLVLTVLKTELPCVIPGFRRDLDELCALLWCYAVFSGSSVPTFRDKLSVLSSKVKKSRPLKMGQIVSKRRYRTTIQRCVIPQKSTDLIELSHVKLRDNYILSRDRRKNE
jgi:hypothetical protein